MANQTVATVRIARNRLPEIAKALPGVVSAILREGAEATLAGAQVRSPFLTGELRESHALEGATPGSLSMRVTVGAEHGEPVHDGTRRMPPRPWLRETAEQTIPATVKEFETLERRL